MVGFAFISDLKAGLEAIDIVFVLFAVGSGLIGAALWALFFHKKERRLFKNINKPIAMVPSPHISLVQEGTMLSENGLFKKPNILSVDNRAGDMIDSKYRLVVLAYEKNSPAFWPAFDAAKNLKIPIIVYSEPGSIMIEASKKSCRHIA